MRPCTSPRSQSYEVGSLLEVPQNVSPGTQRCCFEQQEMEPGAKWDPRVGPCHR